VKLKAVISGLRGLRGGSVVSIASGAFSVGIVAAIRYGLGEDDANLYLFLSALISLVGALSAMGIPEYGQVLCSGKRTGELVVPIGLMVLVVAGGGAIFGPDGRTNTGLSWQAAMLVLVQVCIGTMLTGSELSFRCRLLSSNHVSHYVYQNAAPHLACIAAFSLMSPHAWGPVLGTCMVAGGTAALWRSLASLPLQFKFTFVQLQREQGAFYLQRLVLVFIDTILLLSARDSIQAAQYFAMGMISRVASPVFIVLNVYLAKRQASVLAGSLGAQARSWHLLLASSAAGVALFVCNMVGLDSAWGACLSIILIRLWVILLSYEWQQWLPTSPLVLVVGSATVWGVAAWLIAMQAASLVVITSAAIWLNSAVIVAMSRVREKYAES
jgi:hypothetical protein